jgi:hypothetical protein
MGGACNTNGEEEAHIKVIGRRPRIRTIGGLL